MRSSALIAMSKIQHILNKGERVSIDTLMKETLSSKSSIYRYITLLSQQGVGIYSGKNGYILSKYAEKRDDVHFLRRINGFHASSVIRLQASIASIRNRWRGIEHQKLLQDITKPLQTPDNILKKSNIALISVNKLGL